MEAFWDGEYIRTFRALLVKMRRSEALFHLAEDVLGDVLTAQINKHFKKRNTTKSENHILILDEDREVDFIYSELTQKQKNQIWHIVTALTEQTDVEVKENPKLKEVVIRFSLSPLQERIVRFIGLYQATPFLQSYYQDLNRDTVWCFLSTVLQEVIYKIHREFFFDSALFKYGIITTSSNSGVIIPKLYQKIGLDNSIFDFIHGLVTGDLVSAFLRIENNTQFQPEDFQLKLSTLTVARSLMEMPGRAALYLYGEPGTGKTEFVKSLVLSLGKRPCFLEPSSGNGQRDYNSLFRVSQLIDSKNQVLIIDEAESVIDMKETLYETGASQKGRLNQFLDSFPGKIIFISNLVNGLDSSLVRRFQLCVEFKEFTWEQRKILWDRIDAKEPVFSDQEHKNLACRFVTNAAAISDVCRLGRYLKAEGHEPSAIRSMTEDVLERNGTLMHGQKDDPYRFMEAFYDPRFLNLDVPVEKLFERLKLWLERFRSGGEGHNLLFFGPSGTGKTAFARYLAESLHLQLTTKMAGEILSPFVGETERKIISSFREAEGEALLIDEADTFFFNRSNATKSWEISQVNQFLCSMERFRGLFIATTNMEKIVDAAFFRRFPIKLGFSPPRSEQRFELVCSYFPAFHWNEADRERLFACEGLTPGDIKNVHRNLSFVKDLSLPEVIQELEHEASVKKAHKKAIGFSPAG